MTTRLTHDLAYPAPVEEVAAMLRDPVFRERVCERQHVLRFAVDVLATDEVTEVTVTQAQRVRKVPGFAAKLVGEEIEITQSETWTSDTDGTVRIDVPGVPAHVSGQVRLREDGAATVETVDLTLRVSVPLIGGRLESLLADLVTKALDAEAEVGREYLAG